MKWLVTTWYQPHPIRWLLSPLSLIYRLIISLRKTLYNVGLFKQYKLSVPVIIVGNISVGGTGKTPFVIWLAKQLQQAGFKPGIISRGYGGKAASYPQTVTLQSDPTIVGDEPLIITRQTACPMVVSPNRVEAGLQLLHDNDCDIIISDDGLQHYALGRDIEIVVVDGQRLFGNHYCLPAGPLREPLSRLSYIDFIVHNSASDSAEYTMNLTQGSAINLLDSTLTKPLAEFKSHTVHAIAGIGNPNRFFEQLSQQGLTLIPHAFADHHPYQVSDLQFNDDNAILMTEKDAVKCTHFAHKNTWYIPIEASISGKLAPLIIEKLRKNPHG
ncbi:MAG: tetraacyldisaccharide 4'-kinase [Piscirickettsiaceae bacterium]|nr:tetraacyldisaccharide 4'-kinase [Piscirickettsiaceae bacterium]